MESWHLARLCPIRLRDSAKRDGNGINGQPKEEQGIDSRTSRRNQLVPVRGMSVEIIQASSWDHSGLRTFGIGVDDGLHLLP